jgi:hypothetical protein
MTKIKNFRLTLRAREIARALKNQHAIQITPEVEAGIEHAINDAKRFLEPAAVYATLTRAVLSKTTPIPLAEGAVAASVVAVTVGPQIEAERAAMAEKDPFQAALLAAIQQEALAQATQFALRLIQEQAKEEECEMAPPLPVEEEALLPPLATLLGIQRIGLDLPETAPRLPPHARMTWTLWTPIRKSGSKRSDASARPQTTAA